MLPCFDGPSTRMSRKQVVPFEAAINCLREVHFAFRYWSCPPVTDSIDCSESVKGNSISPTTSAFVRKLQPLIILNRSSGRRMPATLHVLHAGVCLQPRSLHRSDPYHYSPESAPQEVELLNFTGCSHIITEKYSCQEEFCPPKSVSFFLVLWALSLVA